MDLRPLLALIITFAMLKLGRSKVCPGTNSGMALTGEVEDRINDLRNMYTNCTIINGNIEIIYLDDEDLNIDLSFLETIEEVTGYVLIVSVYADYIPLYNLRIIRGRQLYKRDDNYLALYIVGCHKAGTNVGLKELRFRSLNEISNGNVMIVNNNLLCYINNIDWDDILSGENAAWLIHENDHNTSRQCGECDPSCLVTYRNRGQTEEALVCWGKGSDFCQNLTRKTCAQQCDGRCFGTESNECCHTECAGGCTGPLKTDCLSCKHFLNGNSCVPFCPPEKIYDPETYSNVINPDAKYAYGTLCVDKCPDHLLINLGACVHSCGAGRQPNEDSKCEECVGSCRKTCPGVDPASNSPFLHNGNLAAFNQCTIVQGSVIILPSTFKGDPLINHTGLQVSDLSILSTIKEVNGHFKIQGQTKGLTNLSFLRNLEYIHGRVLDSFGASLHVMNTALESLDLVSLKETKNGYVYLAKNPQLCYLPAKAYWGSILGDNMFYEAQNENRSECLAENKVCDPQCTEAGCWGPGKDQCMECKNFKLGKKCLQSCNDETENYQIDDKTCGPCNEQCSVGCTGPGNDNCTACKFAKDGPFCVPSCPKSKYPSEFDVCLPCHSYCMWENTAAGCTGPLNIVGPNGCQYCDSAVVNQFGNVTECLPPDQPCPAEFFAAIHHHHEFVSRACQQCHPECKKCHGPLASQCSECYHYREDGRCVSSCGYQYFSDSSLGVCRRCDKACNGCHGPTASDCSKCHFHKVFSDYSGKDDNPPFNCTGECPDFAPFTTVVDLDDGRKESVCVPEHKADGVTQSKKKATLGIIAGSIIGGIIFVVFVILIIVYIWRHKQRDEENKLRLTARLTGFDESEPLTPTDAKPDMSHLRLLKESELRKGNIIGSGAFGTVYKGLWLPEGDNVKIPVAIKVLQEGTSPNLNKELLEEARIMASVVNPNCVRILAVCMTAQMMLVTQLMPMGCLLDYVRKNRDNIGSKVLLNWCTQIAKGMNYLEGRGIVHRDLAARNVLVQSAGQVKITDFGLAKLLDYDEEAFHASGGKMPIKWLALECIQNRIFTHKSDVWSYGVTIWELFTFGQRPYDNVTAREIPDLLEKGERLPQPSICTIDVYMIMIKCWMLDAFSRPSFKELAEEFAKMARDPGRYLVIHGDSLLRLPSHSYDTRDLVRNMSVAQEGDEQVIMDAEEYLQPQGASNINMRAPPPFRYHSKLDKVREDSFYDNDRQPSSRENSHESDIPLPIREKKYSGLEAAAAMRKQREAAPVRDSVNSRYSSDPCKVLMEGADNLEKPEDETDSYPSVPAPPAPLAGRNEPPLTNMIQPPRLPVDEDDYLQPKSTNPAAYMDLVDGKPEPAHKDKMPPHQAPTPYIGMAQPNAVQNPEYFEGLPPSNAVTTDNLKSEKQPLRGRITSAESDGANSEHDYYNEYDHLNRNKGQNVFINPRTESAV